MPSQSCGQPAGAYRLRRPGHRRHRRDGAPEAPARELRRHLLEELGVEGAGAVAVGVDAGEALARERHDLAMVVGGHGEGTEVGSLGGRRLGGRRPPAHRVHIARMRGRLPAHGPTVSRQGRGQRQRRRTHGGKKAATTPLPTTSAHNWITSPRSRAGKVSMTSPCKSRTSAHPGVMVNRGQEFVVEWSTGHPGRFSYITLLSADDAFKGGAAPPAVASAPPAPAEQAAPASSRQVSRAAEAV